MPSSISPFYKTPQSLQHRAGSLRRRGCVRACMINLEKRGVLRTSSAAAGANPGLWIGLSQMRLQVLMKLETNWKLINKKRAFGPSFTIQMKLLMEAAFPGVCQHLAENFISPNYLYPLYKTKYTSSS